MRFSFLYVAVGWKLCSGWKSKAVERCNGPFGGNTSFPLMFIGNTAGMLPPVSCIPAEAENGSADPVTPLVK